MRGNEQLGIGSRWCLRGCQRFFAGYLEAYTRRRNWLLYSS